MATLAGIRLADVMTLLLAPSALSRRLTSHWRGPLDIGEEVVAILGDGFLLCATQKLPYMKRAAGMIAPKTSLSINLRL